MTDARKTEDNLTLEYERKFWIQKIICGYLQTQEEFRL